MLTNLDLRRKIVNQFHDTLPMAHPGQYKTMEAIRKCYWWPGLYTFIRNYITGCANCQQHKVNTHPMMLLLILIRPSGARPFATITMDFITDLPVSNGRNLLLVVVNHRLTKGVVFILCTKIFGVLEMANALINNMYRRFGLLDHIISDRGTKFTFQTFREMGQLLWIDHRISMVYHPQTNREMEQVNQELETYLWIYCSNNSTG
jgi:hypothetical protein